MVGNGRLEEDLLSTITAIRVRNNDLWMGILEIALKAAPEKTKALINEISINDHSIAQTLHHMANASNDTD